MPRIRVLGCRQLVKHFRFATLPEPRCVTKANLILDKIRALEAELAAEIALRGAELKYSLEQGTIVFEQEILRRHREMRRELWPYLRDAGILTLITAPFIYALIVPFVVLDPFVTIYQRVCFPVYGIAPVLRKDFLVFDRQNLAYLNLVEKINCAYCSYGNGVLAYASEIAARTEQVWCPIKHARRMQNIHAYYRDFVDYGDAEAYQQSLEKLRAKISQDSDP